MASARLAPCANDWDNSYCDNSWDYNDCYRPRRRHHKRYENCWESYSYSYCN